MARRIVAYDVLFADSIEELSRLTQEKITEGWQPDGAQKDKLVMDTITGEIAFLYWQAMVRYAHSTG